jgi:hypothetical protein
MTTVHDEQPGLDKLANRSSDELIDEENYASNGAPESEPIGHCDSESEIRAAEIAALFRAELPIQFQQQGWRKHSSGGDAGYFLYQPPRRPESDMSLLARILRRVVS